MRAPADSVLERHHALEDLADHALECGLPGMAEVVADLAADIRAPWMDSERTRRVWSAAALDYHTRERARRTDWDQAAGELLAGDQKPPDGG